jgi:hypothetical protein
VMDRFMIYGPRRLGWSGYVAREGGVRTECFEDKDNIQMNFEEMWVVDWVCRIRDRKKWCVFMNLRVY